MGLSSMLTRKSRSHLNSSMANVPPRASQVQWPTPKTQKGWDLLKGVPIMSPRESVGIRIGSYQQNQFRYLGTFVNKRPMFEGSGGKVWWENEWIYCQKHAQQEQEEPIEYTSGHFGGDMCLPPTFPLWKSEVHGDAPSNIDYPFKVSPGLDRHLMLLQCLH